MPTIKRNAQIPCLLPHQQAAIEYIQEMAARNSSQARGAINRLLARAGLEPASYDEAMRSVRSHGQIVINFHPDRLTKSGHTVAEGLYRDGIYKSQFETGISSGAPSAFPGGDRDLWERRLFGGAFHSADVSSIDRPKYGSLEVMYHPDGAAPRFGSCYLVLHSEVTKRSTFTYGGSQEDVALDRSGTCDTMDPVMAALMNDIEREHGGLGADGLGIAELLEQLTHGICRPFQDPSTRPLGRALDSFVEAQVHGRIDLRNDVERLVADPSFRGGLTGELLIAIGVKYNIPLNWHPGFVLPVTQVPDKFRGFPVLPLAQRIAGQGTLDAAKIGAAANSMILDPDSWKTWGSFDYTLTQFRRLWFVLVVYGTPNQDFQKAPDELGQEGNAIRNEPARLEHLRSGAAAKSESTQSTIKIDALLTQVKQWAEQQPDITGVLLVGSYARGTARQDSDVDLVILTSNPQRYVDTISFAAQFGVPAKWEKENWGRVTSMRVWYQEGLEVEFGFALPDWAAQPLDAGTQRVISDGIQIVFDRFGLLGFLSGGVTQESAPSS
jgi:predicted nucleotidyltransferase